MYFGCYLVRLFVSLNSDYMLGSIH